MVTLEPRLRLTTWGSMSVPARKVSTTAANMVMNSDPIAATKASAIHSADWNQMLFMKAVLSVRAVRHRLRAGRSRRGPTALLPRTRSSHGICGKYDCELRVQSGNRSIKFASVFDSEVRIGGAARLGELRNRTLALAAGVISSCERFRGT